MKDPQSIVRRAMITEKGSRLREKHNSYLFEVHRDANKIEISQAIHALFKVDVLNVRTINVIGKPKRFGRSEGRRSAWKKAIVTLKRDQTIDLFDQI